MDNQASFSKVTDGSAKVASAGTAVQVSSSSIPCREVHVSAFAENVGVLVLGSSTVLATAGTRRGRTLAPGETVVVRVKDVNLLYIDALNANDGVSYVALSVTS